MEARWIHPTLYTYQPHIDTLDTIMEIFRGKSEKDMESDANIRCLLHPVVSQMNGSLILLNNQADKDGELSNQQSQKEKGE